MRLTKKEQLAIQQKKFCAQYITANWDGCAANDYFANRYDGHIEEKFKFKPKIDFHVSLKEIALVESNLNGALAPMAFTKDKIVSFLKLLKTENVFVPKNIANTEEYIVNYLSMAKRVLENIHKEAYPFQHTSN